VAAVSPRSLCRAVVRHPRRDHPGHLGRDLPAQRPRPPVGVGSSTTVPTPPTTGLHVPPLRNVALGWAASSGRGGDGGQQRGAGLLHQLHRRKPFLGGVDRGAAGAGWLHHAAAGLGLPAGPGLPAPDAAGHYLAWACLGRTADRPPTGQDTTLWRRSLPTATDAIIAFELERAPPRRRFAPSCHTGRSVVPADGKALRAAVSACSNSPRATASAKRRACRRSSHHSDPLNTTNTITPTTPSRTKAIPRITTIPSHISVIALTCHPRVGPHRQEDLRRGSRIMALDRLRRYDPRS
jgi:hypothetical protein